MQTQSFNLAGWNKGKGKAYAWILAHVGYSEDECLVMKILPLPALPRHLARLRPSYPKAAPFISDLIRQLGNYPGNKEGLRKPILDSVERIEGRG